MRSSGARLGARGGQVVVGPIHLINLMCHSMLLHVTDVRYGWPGSVGVTFRVRHAFPELAAGLEAIGVRCELEAEISQRYAGASTPCNARGIGAL